MGSLSRIAAFGLVLVPALVAAEGTIASVEREHQALFERVAPSVVYVSRGGTFGSGFFVRKDGLVLTNAHVVGDASRVELVLNDGRKIQGEVVEIASENIDLALVQAPVKDVLPLQLEGVAEVRVGSFAASVGHGKGAIWTFNTGMVSNIYPSGAERPVIQTQLPLNPGSSGAPLLDRQGRVIGIVTWGITESDSINFAIRSDVALRHLSRLVVDRDDWLVITAPPGVPVFLDGALAGQGPRVALQSRAGRHEAMAVVKGEMRRRAFTFPQTRSVALE